MAKFTVAERYSVIPNDIINMPELSLKAKGLFAYIQWKPDWWEFSAERIAADNKDWLDSVAAWLSELEDCQLLTREKYQDELWHWAIAYTLYAKPCTGFSKVGKATNNSKKEISNKETNNTKVLLVEKTHIEEKKNPPKVRNKSSSSIREVPKVPVRFVPPNRAEYEEILWSGKKWVDKFYEILELEEIYQQLTLEQCVAIYRWSIEFFKEKYSSKIFIDAEWKLQWTMIIFNEYDRFIAYYSENWWQILNLKARLRKWITNSTVFNQK